MKKLLFLFVVANLLSCSSNPKGKVEVFPQSKVYKIVDDVFSLKRMYSNEPSCRYKTEKTIKLDTGKYIINLNFFAKSGIFYNDGKLEDTILIKANGLTRVYLVGGDLSGIFGSDPKIEVEDNGSFLNND